jgi:hypothetical protein
MPEKMSKTTPTTTLILPVSRMKSRLPCAQTAGKDIAANRMIVKKTRILKNFMFQKWLKSCLFVQMEKTSRGGCGLQGSEGFVFGGQWKFPFLVAKNERGLVFRKGRAYICALEKPGAISNK